MTKVYCIERKILFYPEDFKLTDSNGPSEQTETLARPTARLLLALIIRRGEVIPRNELLESVWKDLGAIPSDAALNNHLSLIRKSFDLWGIDRNKLKTIPRIGVIMDIDIEVIAPPTSKDVSPPVPEMGEKRQPFTLASHPNWIFICISALSLFIIFTGPYTYFKHKEIPRMPSVNIKKCSIKLVGNTFSSNAVLPAQEAKDLITTRLPQLDCSLPQDIYVSHLKMHEKSYVHIEICPITSSNVYSNCQENSFFLKDGK